MDEEVRDERLEGMGRIWLMCVEKSRKVELGVKGEGL